MPAHPKSPCSYPGCAALVDRPGKCEKHAKQTRKEADARRPNASKRGYNHRWRKVRIQVLKRDGGLCQSCLKDGRVTEASEVDHIVPTAAGGAFYDDDNLQSICRPCHQAKTVSEGVFGHPGSVFGCE